VNEINDAQMMASLRRTLGMASARQVVAAGNLANGNTPGYKAREVDFNEALDRQLGGVQVATTHARHIERSGGAGGAMATREVDGLAARRDGNTVQVDRELLNMTRASGEFSRAQTALAAKFRLVRYAINESR
jgi:flagellar basal-body rod protein FlgB